MAEIKTFRVQIILKCDEGVLPEIDEVSLMVKKPFTKEPIFDVKVSKPVEDVIVTVRTGFGLPINDWYRREFKDGVLVKKE